MKIYQLPKEFATKWVAALRSGEYKQTGGVYYNPQNNCYCSMGVGLVANEIEINKKGDSTINDDNPFLECMPLTGDGTLWFAIYNLNDHEQKSFPEIADWIEANVDFI
jgi:hypothetical protein